MQASDLPEEMYGAAHARYSPSLAFGSWADLKDMYAVPMHTGCDQQCAACVEVQHQERGCVRPEMGHHRPTDHISDHDCARKLGVGRGCRLCLPLR